MKRWPCNWLKSIPRMQQVCLVKRYAWNELDGVSTRMLMTKPISHILTPMTSNILYVSSAKHLKWLFFIFAFWCAWTTMDLIKWVMFWNALLVKYIRLIGIFLLSTSIEEKSWFRSSRRQLKEKCKKIGRKSSYRCNMETKLPLLRWNKTTFHPEFSSRKKVNNVFANNYWIKESTLRN